MSYLAAAVGAVLAAMIETSVLPEITIGGISPDLVFVLMLVSAMLLGAEEGLIWAFLGGVMIDLLASGDRPLGSATLTLLLVAGLALLIARVIQPPRIAIVVAAAFVLGLLYRALLLVVIALTTGVAVSGTSLATFVSGAAMDAALATVAAWTLRALTLRFGGLMRADW
jgi:rod shape-determining protein MreD